MDSRHSGSRDQAEHLLSVRTNLFDLYIIGKPFHPTVEALHLHKNSEGSPVHAEVQVVSQHSALQVEKCSIFSPYEDGLVPLEGADIYPCFYETQTYQMVIQNRSDRHLSFHHENMNLRKSVKPVVDSNFLMGMLNFQNEVGYTDLEVRVDGQPGLVIRLEIFPTKLDYKNDYYTILEDVNRQIYNLSFDFLRKTYNLTGLKETQHQSLTEFFTILQHVFRQLMQAVERIQAAPHHRLQKELQVSDAAKVKRAGRENISYLSKHPHLLRADDKFGSIYVDGAAYRPEKLIETKRRLDYDTGENRFLRWMLERIVGKLRQIEAKLKERDKVTDPHLQGQLQHMQGQIRRLLQIDFLKQTGPMKQMSVSLVLQMAPGYRDAYRIYLILMKGLSIQGDLFHLSMKDMAQLYEYWCFLKIHELLGRKYKLLKQDIIKVDRSWLFVTLDRTRSASMTYENPRNGERFTLYYNTLPKEEKLAPAPTLSQRPDTVLTLHKHDAGRQQQVYKYVFDAKYRINPAYEGSSYHRDYKTPGPELDDINTMHRYRDAIVYQEKNSHEFERSMFGAYVLFPYGDEELYKEHHFYKSIELVNVGAFPFLPQATELMEKFLDELILDSPEKAYERSTRQKGTVGYYKNKLTGKNVLVGSMRTGQLDVILQDSFYHMPLQNLKDHTVLTQLEYIALCQSRRQFARDAGIRWYGEIESWEVRKRKDIKERPPRPGIEEDLYVYFRIREWIRKEQPIALGGRGIEKCLYTSKYMFDRAWELAELYLDSEEDLRVWREKRRLGKVRVELDHEKVDLAKRVLGVEVEE